MPSKILAKADVDEAGLIKETSSTEQTDDDKRVIAAINARKVLRTEDINHINNISNHRLLNHCNLNTLATQAFHHNSSNRRSNLRLRPSTPSQSLIYHRFNKQRLRRPKKI